MLTKELLKKIRHIQIYTSRIVNDTLAGQYHSTFKGMGMEFDEVREYQPGDEIRTIDWNVTARMGRPFIKKFIEERELTVMLAVDLSASGEFGTNSCMKNELAAELSAVLAFSAIKNNDKVGLLIFTDRIEKYIPPKKGKKHVLHVISEILSFKPVHKGTDINAGLEFLNSVTKRRTVIFLISDFISDDYKRSLQITNKRHDLIVVTIEDSRERTLPDIGILNLKDAETGEMVMVDTGDIQTRKTYKILSDKYIQQRDKQFKEIDVDTIHIQTDRPYLNSLIRFFKGRSKLR